MKRYSEAAGTEGSVIEAADGEYVLYEDHCEAMKRIAGDGAQAEPICPACNGSGQIATGCDEFSESICKTCDGTGFAAQPPAAAEAEKRDAERFRWLVAEHDRIDPLAAVVWKANANRNSSEWVNTISGQDLINTIDIESASAASKEGA